MNRCLKNKQAAEVLSFLAFEVCGLCIGQWPCVRDNREDSYIRLGVARYGKQLNIFCARNKESKDKRESLAGLD